ncbi:MAG: hypothetical protein ACRDRO_23930 [Pseudonocardiaceae bacterium]
MSVPKIPPAFYRRLHAVLTLLWAVAIVPTLIWWKDSILWVSVMSLWANIAAHAAAWQGTRAEEANNNPVGS